ncbi:hypothetical protein EJ04DRAFT_517513 [Polyplosphaeria fusca]|uniref:Calcineurin-like phosphoesterase domain-containing protein n=1 Tax=Polyplosphaeria fusca TaxID=682080 RepID=A0A9P4QGU5_9PLEO|nr:hypothetical protein EJ04DRAFT_517513 [Polyplosphaeria fusca]
MTSSGQPDWPRRQPMKSWTKAVLNPALSPTAATPQPQRRPEDDPPNGTPPVCTLRAPDPARPMMPSLICKPARRAMNTATIPNKYGTAQSYIAAFYYIRHLPQHPWATTSYAMPSMKRLSGLFSAPRTSFQILSDLHLSHADQYLTFHIPSTAPYLILAGNNGRLLDYEAYLSFLIRRCHHYDRVFLVLGALEFSGLRISEGLELARKMEQEQGVKGKLVVLDRQRYEVEGTGVVLLGCTLWSHIPQAAERAVVKKIPEFDHKHGIKDWSVGRHNAAHKADFQWLLSEVQSGKSFAGGQTNASSNSDRRFLVVTSFAPDLQDSLSPWQVDSPWSSAYGTDLLRGVDWNGVKTWIFGSTGRSTKFKKYGVKVVANQRGEAGEEDKGVLGDGLNEKDRQEVFDVTKIVKV